MQKLEKENLYYKDIVETNTAEWEEQGQRVVVLEKENAQLKTDYEVLSCSVGDFGELQDKLEEEQRKNNGLSDNLTKAKEHIRTLISCLIDWVQEGDKDYCYIADAEQFINSEVEK